MILALRAHTEVVGRKKKPWQAKKEHEPQWADTALVFDNETPLDKFQSLNFGVAKYCQLESSGYVSKQTVIFHPDDLPLAKVQTIASAAIEIRHNERLPVKVMSRLEFIKRVLLPVALEERGLIVGFNLPFDLSRLAVDSRWAKRSEGGVSLILAWRKNRGSLSKMEEDRWTPRIRIEPKDGKSAFIRFTSGRPRRRNRRPKRIYRGRFLDLRTLCFALHSKAYSLKSACKAFQARPKMDHEPTGEISISEVLYCHGDVESTLDLLNKAREELGKHDIDLAPEKAHSPASIVKAYFKKMGLKPPKEKFKLSARVLGHTMNAYMGGRAECRIRHAEVPVAMVDFTSQYSTVNILLGLWEFLRASEIETRTSTEEVREFLDNVTLDQAFDRSFWRRLPFYALIEPEGDRLPVRTYYNQQSSNIGLNLLHSRIPLWYPGPDLVAAKLQGRAPKILKAFTLVPVGIQRGLMPVRLRGETVVDPRRDDFFKAVIEARKRAKSDPSLEEVDGKSIDFALKVLGSAGSYGLFVELNPEHAPGEGTKIQVYADDPRYALPTRTKIVEKHGRWYFPPFGALTTSAGRLLLTMLECLVRDAGGAHLMCDTDSMGIVASPSEGLVPCAGGPHQLEDGHDGVKSLSFPEVEKIVERFTSLNPYSFPGSILEIKKDSTKRQLYGFAVSSKRYALYCKPTEDEIKIEKASGHALGYLQPPDERPFNQEAEADQWIVEAWEWTIKKFLGIPAKEPRWFDTPAVMPIKITTRNVMRPLQARERRAPYARRVKPFNFALMLQTTGIEDTPIAPFTKDASKWRGLDWTGTRSGRRLHLSDADIKTLGEKIKLYSLSPEHKSLAPDGGPCQKNTQGLLSPMPVEAHDVLYMGKETDTRYISESETGEGDRLEPEHVVYRPWATDKMAVDPRLLYLVNGQSLRALAREAGLDKKTIIKARRGKLQRKSTVRALKRACRSLARKRAGIMKPR